MTSPGGVPALTISTSPRPPPPTADEIQRKLGSPSAVGQVLSTSQHSQESREGDMQRRMSTGRAAAVVPGSPGLPPSREDVEPSSPLHSTIGLSAISEASDGNVSGSDSDASSIAGGGSPRGAGKSLPAVSRNFERLRLSRENTRMSDNIAIRSGYLMKKGERRKAWKKRWFVLRGGQVAMYKNDKEYQLLRLIPLTEIHACAPIGLKKHSFTFGIVTPDRTYYVKANSDAEVQDWCVSVERAKEEAKAGATVTSIDTPGSDSRGSRTPQGPQTPSAAIPIPISASPSGLGLGVVVGGSFNTATSPSPPGPFSLPSNGQLSSSFTSTSTAPYPPSTTGPRVPPNSFAAGGLGVLGLHNSDANVLELGGVDAGLEMLADQHLGRQQRAVSSSGTSSGGEGGMGSSLVVPPGGYFIPRSGSSHTNATNAPSSPGGIISSSEDEDGFDEGWQGSTAQTGITFSDTDERRGSAVQGGSTAEVAADSGFGDPNKVILSGYLMKQGKRKNWRKRWFVLMSGRLMYSRSHMDTKIHRQIPLAHILDAIEYDAAQPAPSARRPPTSGPLTPSSSSILPTSPLDDGKRNYEHCFKIITPKRTYLVCAPTEEDEIRWLAALQCLVARKTGAAPVASPAPTSSPVRKSISLGMDQLSPSVESARQVSAPTTTGVGGSMVGHGRQRSVTDAAKKAVRDVERRFQTAVKVERER